MPMWFVGGRIARPLGLVLNMVVLWNSVYLDAIVKYLREQVSDPAGAEACPSVHTGATLCPSSSGLGRCPTAIRRRMASSGSSTVSCSPAGSVTRAANARWKGWPTSRSTRRSSSTHPELQYARVSPGACSCGSSERAAT